MIQINDNLCKMFTIQLELEELYKKRDKFQLLLDNSYSCYDNELSNLAKYNNKYINSLKKVNNLYKKMNKDTYYTSKEEINRIKEDLLLYSQTLKTNSIQVKYFNQSLKYTIDRINTYRWALENINIKIEALNNKIDNYNNKIAIEDEKVLKKIKTQD